MFKIKYEKKIKRKILKKVKIKSWKNIYHKSI